MATQVDKEKRKYAAVNDANRKFGKKFSFIDTSNTARMHTKQSKTIKEVVYIQCKGITYLKLKLKNTDELYFEISKDVEIFEETAKDLPWDV